MKNFYFIISLLTTLVLSQTPLWGQDRSEYMSYSIEGKDTIYHSDIAPAYKKYREKVKRNKGKEWRKYYRTVHNFAKTYPYALVAKEKREEADKYLATHDLSRMEKERYLKKYEKELFNTFEKPLRNLTFSQGRMLLRLIDRELGLTSFYIIKDYRGKAAAGFWQGIAKIFGADLKTPYDRFGEDKELEELVKMYQQGEFAYLYISIFGKYPPKPAVTPKNDFRQMNIY
jgi:hypothetical protein